ncbi:interleukin-15 [Pseudonaja textilis]|uniref:interleukin-15 n=1 Tax=Pseudonaja textilis TaxID=8673 RepID=UPI000EA89293|nr:interleukin-15 [Pseudonaja textilis]XP_026553876.1 interleukin-15 [Pseudonaja textilis]
MVKFPPDRVILKSTLKCSLPNQGDFQIRGLQFPENLRECWLRVLEIEISASGGFLLNERPMPGSHPVSPSMGQEIFQKGIMVSDAVLKSVLQLPENLKNKFLVFYFILSLYLPYIPATRSHILEAMLKDLERIKVSPEIDAYLYTADLNYPSYCNQSVMKCFQLEMEVVSYESKFGDRKFYDSVNSIVRLVKYLLPIETNTDTQTCQRCETYKEKKYSDFITDFMFVIQRINREETKVKIGH